MILIGYDGSDHAQAAIRHAGELFADRRVTILTVWRRAEQTLARSTGGRAQMAGLGYTEETDRATQHQAEREAAEGARLATTVGLEAEPQACPEELNVAKTILAQASKLEASAIVLGSRGHGRVKSLVLGSVSHAVLEHARRPVLTVPSPEPGGSGL